MNPKNRISRRSFLKILGAFAGGAALESCRPHLSAPPATAPLSSPIATTPPASPRASVAIARASSYDPKLVRQQVQAVFDALGGLQDVVRPGDSAAIKVNLTGGVFAGRPPAGTTPPESYVTHPLVAQAVGELLRDAGAKKIYIIESAWGWESYEEWGYVSMAKDLGADLIDLNRPYPYADYASIPAGDDWLIYKNFLLNHLLEEVDVLVSVPKMKCHYLLGITQSMKNLVGLAPSKLYERKPGDGNRSSFHGADDEIKNRLPRVVIDLNRARPINLSVIDGIKTVEGGEGPWIETLNAINPGLLIAGKNPVSTDAVAVAAMGFDPTGDYPAAPFLRADNHLNLAHQLGLGSNHLDEIEVLGESLEDVRVQFQPAR